MAGATQHPISQLAIRRRCFPASPLPTFSSHSSSSFRSIHCTTKQTGKCWSLSMNGCGGDPSRPVETIQTRTFPLVPTPGMALLRLNSVISELNSAPPDLGSGIIRLEVPIQQHVEAIGWLNSQGHLLPRCFFSGRRQSPPVSHSINGETRSDLVSVAGVGAAVFFRHSHPFSFDDWRCIKRFLSEDCPLIRAYGAIRFDSNTNVSFEWEGFGSFYFMIPLVEFLELEGSSMLATTIAWDRNLSWTWDKALDMLRVTIHQISSIIVKSRKSLPSSFILRNNHVPNKASWDASVNKALQMINGSRTELVKVVLARSSTIITATDVDPLAWLAQLQVEEQNTYQFCIQPPGAPAFIGNTPEQLFHRNHLSISSEALAGTRGRGESETVDNRIGSDLLHSPKDHLEFTIVRESIRRKLEEICTLVLVEPKKVLRKLPRVQHLYAKLSGRMKNVNDEFDILVSLHPSPAVCGFPTEVARRFIAETEMFDRGMYAGPVGWFGGRETEFAVGIRSALVEKGVGTLLYAGAGVVEGTNSALEWEELELKTSQFMKLIESEKTLDAKKCIT